jgi:3D (Asp-Asp-Asp) domain-containing protein
MCFAATVFMIFLGNNNYTSRCQTLNKPDLKQTDSFQEAKQTVKADTNQLLLDFQKMQDEDIERIKSENQKDIEIMKKANIKSKTVKKQRKKEPKTKVSQFTRESLGTFQLTAYTLRECECSKTAGNAGYGITASGHSLLGEDLTNRMISVDPNVISLGSVVYIEFPKEIRYLKFNGRTIDLNGDYTAVDTGSAIKSHKIDLFVGEGRYYLDKAYEIGVRQVKVYRRRVKG